MTYIQCRMEKVLDPMSESTMCIGHGVYLCMYVHSYVCMYVCPLLLSFSCNRLLLLQRQMIYEDGSFGPTFVSVDVFYSDGSSAVSCHMKQPPPTHTCHAHTFVHCMDNTHVCIHAHSQVHTD